MLNKSVYNGRSAYVKKTYHTMRALTLINQTHIAAILEGYLLQL